MAEPTTTATLAVVPPQTPARSGAPFGGRGISAVARLPNAAVVKPGKAAVKPGKAAKDAHRQAEKARKDAEKAQKDAPKQPADDAGKDDGKKGGNKDDGKKVGKTDDGKKHDSAKGADRKADARKPDGKKGGEAPPAPVQQDNAPTNGAPTDVGAAVAPAPGDQASDGHGDPGHEKDKDKGKHGP